MDRNLAWHCMSEDVSVALRKESVDRNRLQRSIDTISQVALRKESVDRNMRREMSLMRPYGRSPQGERG